MARRFTTVVPLAAAVLAGACSEGPVTSRRAPEGGIAPLVAAAPKARVAAGRYIVVFKDEVESPAGLARSLAAAHGATLHYTYEHALKGFAATLTPAAVEGLRHDPHVAYIEPDQLVRATATIQNNAPWGLDRIDQRAGRDRSYIYQYTGSGVRVYVIDSGIDLTHPQFGGRASLGIDLCPSCNSMDGYGHGTQVAGVVGSATYGVAKGVKLVSVRVLDNGGNGLASTVAQGVDWVTGQKQANPGWQMVANMSLIYDGDTALDAAVDNSIAAGVTYVAGAGNEPIDACGSSPARVPAVITVGAVNKADAKSDFSAYGPCVDLYAPGQFIPTTYVGGGTVDASGTSVAAPHVAGFAALYLQAYPGTSPSNVHAAAVNYATTGRMIELPAGSNNRILFTMFTPYVTVASVVAGSPTTLTAGGLARGLGGTVQPEWRDATTGSAWTPAPGQVTPNADGTWSGPVPVSNPCHDYDVRAKFAGVTSNAAPYHGLGSAYCSETARVTWIQPAWMAGSGWTPGSMAVAGQATGAPPGTTVKMWWRNLSTGGGWVKVAYEPTTLSDGTWLNEIPNANPLQRYEVYVVYDAFTSASCTYPGNNNIMWC